jgi:hypothetical protein
MKTLNALSILVPALLLLAGKTSAADLVTNGSFESPDVSIAPGRVNGLSGAQLKVLPDGTAIPGWQISGAPVSVTLTPYNEGYETLSAGDGSQALDLTADVFGGEGGITQTIATTPGKDYVLTFQLGAYPGSIIYHGPVRVRVTAGATTVEFMHDPTTTASGCVWQPFAMPFIAIAAATPIQFQCLEAAGWAGIDRVAITEVSPAAEPPALTLVAVAVAGGGGTSTSNDRRFSLSGTIGQSDAGLRESGGRHLFGGFWGPVNRLNLTRQGNFLRVSWDFGLGFGELQTARELSSDGTATWLPVSLAGNAASVMLPATDETRFFRIREN